MIKDKEHTKLEPAEKTSELTLWAENTSSAQSELAFQAAAHRRVTESHDQLTTEPGTYASRNKKVAYLCNLFETGASPKPKGSTCPGCCSSRENSDQGWIHALKQTYIITKMPASQSAAGRLPIGTLTRKGCVMRRRKQKAHKCAEGTGILYTTHRLYLRQNAKMEQQCTLYLRANEFHNSSTIRSQKCLDSTPREM